MTSVEFVKQIFRLRTYVLLGLMVAIATVATVIISAGDSPGGGRGGEGLTSLADHSGANAAVASLSFLGSRLLPLIVAFFAGSAVSEEASWGTLRYLLIRPVSRNRLLASKLTVVAVLALAAAAVIGLAGALEGTVAFGWEHFETSSGTTIPPADAVARLAIATLFVAWSLMGVMAFGLAMSTVTDTPLASVASTFGLVIVCQILDSLAPLGEVQPSGDDLPASLRSGH